MGRGRGWVGGLWGLVGSLYMSVPRISGKAIGSLGSAIYWGCIIPKAQPSITAGVSPLEFQLGEGQPVGTL